MLRSFFIFGFLLFISSAALFAQTNPPADPAVKPLKQDPKPAGWFRSNWIRGHADFDVAPSHNEPDLGRCAFPQPPSAGGANSQCTAYARYFMSGYIEIQPLSRTLARHLLLFLEPKFSFGNNIPQVKYTASMEPIAFDRTLGVAFQLPRNFEIRAAQHQVNFLGRYSGNLGPADLHTNGPYGLYATFGVRWSFGGYDRVPGPY
jgi:hypothetical protein